MKIQLGETGWNNNAKPGPVRVRTDGTFSFQIDAEGRGRERQIQLSMTRDEGKQFALAILGELLG